MPRTDMIRWARPEQYITLAEPAAIFRKTDKGAGVRLYRETKRLAWPVLIGAMIAGAGPDAYAAGKITNTATVEGQATRGTLLYTPPATVEIDVAAPPPTVAVTLTYDGVSFNSGAVGDDRYPDELDVVTFLIGIRNTSAVRLEGVWPANLVASFGPDRRPGDRTELSDVYVADGSNSILDPGQSVFFMANYTLSEVDALLGAIGQNMMYFKLGATSANYANLDGTSVEIASNIDAVPILSLVKTYSFVTDAGAIGKADVGDVIRYAYEVANEGNIAINTITVSDVHEGALLAAGAIGDAELVEDGPLAVLGGAYTSVVSGSSPDESWPVLQPGAKIRFHYTHTVTQEEFDAQD